jgi:hypothetical protein
MAGRTGTAMKWGARSQLQSFLIPKLNLGMLLPCSCTAGNEAKLRGQIRSQVQLGNEEELKGRGWNLTADSRSWIGRNL